MSLPVWTVAGLDRVARYICGLDTTRLQMVLRLFVNDVTPTPNSVLGDFTECTLEGYSAYDLADFTFQSTPGGLAEYRIPALNYTFTGTPPAPVFIRGFYVSNYGPALLWWAQRWDTAFVNPASGASIGVPVVVSVRNVF